MNVRIVCAANRCPKTGHMILGARHWDEQMHIHCGLYRYAGYTKEDCDFKEQGFINQHGDFLTRHEAWVIAEEAGQIIRRVGGDGLDRFGLFSENLY